MLVGGISIVLSMTYEIIYLWVSEVEVLEERCWNAALLTEVC